MLVEMASAAERRFASRKFMPGPSAFNNPGPKDGSIWFKGYRIGVEQGRDRIVVAPKCSGRWKMLTDMMLYLPRSGEVYHAGKAMVYNPMSTFLKPKLYRRFTFACGPAVSAPMAIFGIGVFT